MSDRAPEFADIVRHLIAGAAPDVRAELEQLAEADRLYGESFAREKRSRVVRREGEK